MTTEQDVDRLWKLMDSIPVAMMTTHDGQVLRSRPMRVHADQPAGRLWIFANAQDHLVDEVAHDPRVNLAFSDPDDADFVSVSGEARIVNDKEKVADLWSPAISAWYAKGYDDPNIRLLEVEAQQGEMWDSNANTMARVWEIAVAATSGRTPTTGDNAKVNFDR